MLKFRLLRADEIDARISICNGWGVGILLYKDARVDQDILDETVGPMNWQRHHYRDNANCLVSIWDPEKKYWVEKDDTGTVSNTEAEKGLASDSFKRACFNWGIGRELYSAPSMFVKAEQLKTLKESGNGRWTCRDTFRVTDIQYDDRKICFVQILNEKTGKLIDFGKRLNAEDEDPKSQEVTADSEPTPEESPKFSKERGAEKISPEEIEKLTAACEKKGDGWLAKALKACKVRKITNISKTQYLALMAQLGAVA